MGIWLAAVGGGRREPGHAGAGRGGAGLAAKKKSVHTAERDTERIRALRAAFVEAVQAEDFTCFKFVDETSTNLTYGRRYARAEGGAACPPSHAPARQAQRDARGDP